MGHVNGNSSLRWLLSTAAGVYIGFYIPQAVQKIGKWSRAGRASPGVDDWIFLTIVLLVILYAAFARDLDRIGKILVYKFHRINSSYEYNALKVRIEYLDDAGALVSVCRTDHISRLKRKKRMMNVSIYTDGIILKDRTSAINSGFTFPADNAVNFQCYFHDDNIVERQHYAKYNFVLKDGFLRQTEYWIFSTERYCRYYVLEIRIPATRKITKVKLFRHKKHPEDVVAYNDPGWELVTVPKTMIIQELNRSRIVTNVAGLKPTDSFMLVWSLN
jgi:hypothetical protein